MLTQIKFRVILQDVLADQIRNTGLRSQIRALIFFVSKRSSGFISTDASQLYICHLQKVFCVEKKPCRLSCRAFEAYILLTENFSANYYQPSSSAFSCTTSVASAYPLERALSFISANISATGSVPVMMVQYSELMLNA